MRKIGPDLNGHRLLLRVNPDIARALKEEESAVLRDLRQSIGKDVTDQAGRAAASRAVRRDGGLRNLQFTIASSGRGHDCTVAEGDRTDERLRSRASGVRGLSPRFGG